MGVTTVSGAHSITRLVRERRRQGSGGGRGRVPRELAVLPLVDLPTAYVLLAVRLPRRSARFWRSRLARASGPVSKAVGAFLERFGRPPASAMVPERHRAQKLARFLLYLREFCLLCFELRRQVGRRGYLSSSSV